MINIPKELKSDRIILRPHKIEDKDPFINLMTDKRVTKTLNFAEKQKSTQGATELLNTVIDSYSSENPIFALAIVDKFGKQYLGSCGLSLIDEYKRYEIFYSLLYRYWGNGYA
ncbi:MAG: GNAT family N-acetyltransferase, partial [Candidatus Lokiarchaeota archaeon]|nr:GNAT family N-acetyltransferase [Candidatus Lokiarchaeota archaeon]MBD3202401.1 GNAT family N-acetyltransferase [Candidatus Lokiarchaeota archaeon]